MFALVYDILEYEYMTVLSFILLWVHVWVMSRFYCEVLGCFEYPTTGSWIIHLRVSLESRSSSIISSCFPKWWMSYICPSVVFGNFYFPYYCLHGLGSSALTLVIGTQARYANMTYTHRWIDMPEYIFAQNYMRYI